MAVTRSELVGKDTAAAKDELWAQGAAWLADWSSGIQLRAAWVVEIARGRSGAETRTGRVTKPGRDGRLDLVALDDEDSVRMGGLARRMASARTPVPLVCDVTTITAEVFNGAEEIAVEDTTLRRFQAGGWAIAVQYGQGGDRARCERFELLKVTGVSEGLLAVEATEQAWGIGAEIMPVIEARLQLEHTQRLLLSNLAEWSLGFEETEGASALDPLATPGGETPAILDDVVIVDGYPVWLFEDETDWGGALDQATMRHGREGGSGTGQVVDLEGERTLERLGLPLTFLNRRAAWRWLTWFDWRGGSVHPFLMANPRVLLPEVIGISGANLTLKRGVLPDTDWGWFRYAAVRLRTGGVVIRKVDSVTHDGEETIIEATAAWGVSAGSVLFATSAHLMRHDNDEVQEQWTDTEQMSSSTTVVEMDLEGEVSIEGLEGLLTGTEVPD